MLHGMSKLQWSHILPFQWLLDLVLMLDSIHNIFEITLNLCRLCSWRQRRFFQASAVHEDPCNSISSRINPVMGKAWAVESWKPSNLRHGLLCRCCVNCCKSYIPAHQSPKNEESTALFQFTPVYHCSSLLFQVTVQGVPVLREDEGATINSTAPVSVLRSSVGNVCLGLSSLACCWQCCGINKCETTSNYKIQFICRRMEHHTSWFALFHSGSYLFTAQNHPPPAMQSTEWQPQTIAPFYTFQEENYLHKSFYILLYYLSTQIWLSVEAGGGYCPTIKKTLRGDARKISSLMTCLYFQNNIFFSKIF